jgi:2-C-methyl-D-erythritol 4-phosphate cytidylyltransferase
MANVARDVCSIILATEADGDLIWREVAGKPLLVWSIAALASAPSVARIALVVPAMQVGHAQAVKEHAPWEKDITVLSGSARRRDSVEFALRALPDECKLLAIHDATRPLITPRMIEAGVALAREAGAAIPVEPVKETIKRVRDGVIVGAVPREGLKRVQTPQVFRRALLLEAYQRAAPDLDIHDETALLLAAGLPLGSTSCYVGDPENLRVASVDDLPVVEELLLRRDG